MRNVIAGTGEIEVNLIGYSATGEVVGEGKGEANTSGWAPISVALNGKGKISYFAITTGTVDPSRRRKSRSTT